MFDWKIILALAILAMPLSYCEIQSRKSTSVEKIACIEQKGDWRANGRCEFKE